MGRGTGKRGSGWIAGAATIAVLAGACTSATTKSSTAAEPVESTTSVVRVEPTSPTPPGPAAILYRLDNELGIDDYNTEIATFGPARWRSGYPTQITYGIHSNEREAGVFLFEQVRLRDIESGDDRVLLDIADHSWSQAGHFDWDATGSRLVFAAMEDDGVFRPQVLDVASGQVTRVATSTQIIDTVFADDGRLLGIDTANAASQSETLTWVDLDGTATAIAPSSGVNRDPVVTPDLRHIANIRAGNLLSRVGLGRWDLVITDVESGTEWTIGDGGDGFGPPRWIDNETLIAKHARYNSAGIVASIPDVVIVNIATGEITVVEGLQGAWDPDPRI